MTVRWTRRYPRSTWLAAAGTLVFINQTSMSYFLALLKLGEAVKVTGWFNSVHVPNAGAAFSYLTGAGGWQRWFFIVCSGSAEGFASLKSLEGLLPCNPPRELLL